MTEVREFANHWGHGTGTTWSNRVKEELIEVGKGDLFIPVFRPFDLLDAPNKPLVILANESTRLGVEAVLGTGNYFHRNCDFDEIFFQWSGHTTVETEYGVFEMGPAEIMLIPGGIAHRSTGTEDSLRLFMRSEEPMTPHVTAADQIGHTDYELRRIGGPDWKVPKGKAKPKKGKVMERIITWRDKPDEITTVERNYDNLVGVASAGRPVEKLRVFDFFTEVSGRRGPGPTLYRSSNFIVEVFNTDGEQFVFHRGNRSDEFQLQFQGQAINSSELVEETLVSGMLSIVPRGISHSVLCSNAFRRLVTYTKEAWEVMVDVTKPAYSTTFEPSETVIERASWQDELDAGSAAAK